MTEIPGRKLGCHSSSSLLSVVNLKNYIRLSVELCIKEFFPVQSSRNLLRRGHNRIPEISAEYFVSKLVSVILKHILTEDDD